MKTKSDIFQLFTNMGLSLLARAATGLWVSLAALFQKPSLYMNNNKIITPILSLAFVLCGFTLFVSSQTTQADIILQDGGLGIMITNNSDIGTLPVTVTAGAKVLVVLVEDYHATPGSEPPTISWAGTNLTRAIQEDHTAGTTRGEAIYYLFNPPVETASNLSVTVSGTANATYVEMSYYTLSGVDTTVPPVVAGANTGSSTINTLTCSANGIINASWAAVNATSAGGAFVSLTGTGGTTTVTNHTDPNNTILTAGYISGLSSGSDTFTITWSANAKDNFEVAIFTPVVTPPPATPANLTATAGSPAQVALTWNASVGAATYNLKRGTSSGTYTVTNIVSGALTNYQDLQVISGTTYYYVVSAVNSIGESANSAEMSATPSAPPFPPTGLTASYSGGGQLTLQWNTNACFGATIFNVKDSVTSGGETTIGSTNGNSYIVNGLTGGVTYYFEISSVGAGGETNSAEVNALVSPINIQDGSPMAISYTTGTNNISQPFTVTPGANVMVVLVEDKNATNSEPATLAWNGQTLTRDVQTSFTIPNYRSVAIYHLFNPTPGTDNITGSLLPGVSDMWVTAYTLNGVDPNIPPVIASVNSGTDTADQSESVTANGVESGSWAAVNTDIALGAETPVTINAVNASAVTIGSTLAVDGGDAGTTAAAGCVAGLGAGADTFTVAIPGTATRINFAVDIFSPPSPPTVVTQPHGLVVFTNVEADLSVTVRGSPALGYQWYRNTTTALSDSAHIVGSASNVLTINNTTLADTGNYTLVITNVYGSVTSSVANITVIVPSGTYERAVMTNSPFAFYSFSETNNPSAGGVVAYDSIGTFNGTYGVNSSNGFDGIAGPRTTADGLIGFPDTDTALGTVGNLANSYVTLPAFNLNNGAGANVLTITAWIKPAGLQSSSAGIVYSRSGTTTAGLSYFSATNTDGNHNLGYNWNNDVNNWSWNSGLEVPTNIWSLVSLVVTPTNATIYVVNTNGLQASTHTNAHVAQIFEGQTLIGNDSLNVNRTFNGSIDEVALFGQALTQSQIFSLFTASSGITIISPTIPTQPASVRAITNTTATFSVVADGYPYNYQWYEIIGGVTNAISNATNASYNTAPVQVGDSGDGFFVVVSNQAGMVRSSTAYLSAGYLLLTSGFLNDDQYDVLTAPFDTTLLTSQLYPASPFFSTNTPFKTEYLSQFHGNQDLPGNGGQRIYGWFTPAVSGDYVFFMTAADAGSLWLSTDNTPANVYEIAQTQGAMVDRDWTCLNTACSEHVSYYAFGEWRSDQFISGGGNSLNDYMNIINFNGWLAYPSFNSGDSGIALVAGTPYYIELDSYYKNAPAQSAAVTYKMAGAGDPISNSPSLLIGGNISTLVSDSVLPIPHPVIANVGVLGQNVILSGTNGLVNEVYYVLSTTNVATPLTNWMVTATHVFDTNGNFKATNAITPGATKTFYRLQQLQ